MLREKRKALFTPRVYDDLGKYKINADYVKMYAQEECYRELMVSYLPMLPLLEHTVRFKEADYILYMHMYARCEDYSDFVVRQLKLIAEKRKPGAEIIVLGKAANAEKLLNGDISNITFWGDHFTEKLGEKFNVDIREQYFVYDDIKRQLAIWPVDGCLLKCKFCRRCYMDIKFESISLDEIRSTLDRIRLNAPELMQRISLRAENLTEYGIDLYGKPMLHELIDLIDSYDEVKEIKIPIGLCIGEINDDILTALCNSKKITNLALNVEAGTDRLLHLIGKPHTCSQASHIFNKIHEANPNAKISTNIMLGLPTEDVGDMFETAKFLVDIKPNYLQINFFVLSPNSPLAVYPQISESCTKYHLKQLLQFLRNSKPKTPVRFSCICRRLEKKPNSRACIKERAKLEIENRKLIKLGFLPNYLWMELEIRTK